MDWRQRGICRDEDPELFFPVGNSGPALLQIAEAKTVCRRCPVVSDCLSWALESGQDAGVWGGMSEDERRAFKRRNARIRARSSQREAGEAVTTSGEPHARRSHTRTQPVECRELTVEEVQAVVCERLGISMEQLTSQERTRHLGRARRVAMYLAYDLTAAAPADIAKAFNRSHPGFFNAVYRTEDQITTDLEMQALVSGLTAALMAAGRVAGEDRTG